MLLESEQRARAQAEAVNRLKDEFLATLSHELRTPLNAILGWSHLLTSRKSDPAMVERAIGVIRNNAMAQSQLIEDILDVSRIIGGKLRLKLAPGAAAGSDRGRARFRVAGRPGQGHRRSPATSTTSSRSPAITIACSRSSGTCSRTPSSSRRAKGGSPSA